MESFRCTPACAGLSVSMKPRFLHKLSFLFLVIKPLVCPLALIQSLSQHVPPTQFAQVRHYRHLLAYAKKTTKKNSICFKCMCVFTGSGQLCIICNYWSVNSSSRCFNTYNIKKFFCLILKERIHVYWKIHSLATSCGTPSSCFLKQIAYWSIT